MKDADGNKSPNKKELKKSVSITKTKLGSDDSQGKEKQEKKGDDSKKKQTKLGKAGSKDFAGTPSNKKRNTR